MVTPEQIQDQVDRNYKAFKALLPEIIMTDVGKFGKWALLHDEKLDALFDTMNDALTAAQLFYPDGLYSIQEVRYRPVDLGWFSHAVSQRTV